MSENLFAEADAYVAPLLRNEAWNELDSDKKTAIFKRAENDIIIYGASFGTEIDLSKKTVRLALFEQMIHIAEELCRLHNGAAITSENITDFGSRSYDNPDYIWISPRAQEYLQQSIPQRRIKIIR